MECNKNAKKQFCDLDHKSAVDFLRILELLKGILI